MLVDLSILLKSGGTKILKAYTTETPGVLVHKSADIPGRWNVTHWAGTGLYGAFKTKKAALAAAEGLRPLADWTKTAEELGSDEMLGQEVVKMRRML